MDLVCRLAASFTVLGFITLLLVQPTPTMAQVHSRAPVETSMAISHHPSTSSAPGAQGYHRRPAVFMESQVDGGIPLRPSEAASTRHKSLKPRAAPVTRSMSFGTMAEIMGVASSDASEVDAGTGLGSTGSCDVPGILQCIVLPGRALVIANAEDGKGFPDFDEALFRPLASKADEDRTSPPRVNKVQAHFRDMPNSDNGYSGQPAGWRESQEALKMDSTLPQSAAVCSEDFSGPQEECLLTRKDACKASEEFRNASAVEKALAAIDLISYLAGHYYSRNCTDSYEKSLNESVQRSRICDPGVAMRVWSTCVSEFYADMNRTSFSEEKAQVLRMLFGEDDEELDSNAGMNGSPESVIRGDEELAYSHDEPVVSLPFQGMSQKGSRFYDRSSSSLGVNEDDVRPYERRNKEKMEDGIRLRASRSASWESVSDSGSVAIDEEWHRESGRGQSRLPRNSNDDPSIPSSLAGDGSADSTKEFVCCPKMRFLKCIFAAVWRSDDCVVKRHKRNMLRMGILFTSQFYGKDLAHHCSNVSSSQLKECFATPASSTSAGQPSSAPASPQPILLSFLATPAAWSHRIPLLVFIQVVSIYAIHHLFFLWYWGAFAGGRWRVLEAVHRRRWSQCQRSSEVTSVMYRRTPSETCHTLFSRREAVISAMAVVILPSLGAPQQFSSDYPKTRERGADFCLPRWLKTSRLFLPSPAFDLRPVA